MRRRVQDNQYWKRSRLIKTYRVINEVRVDINARSELSSKLESKSKSSGDQSGGQVGQGWCQSWGQGWGWGWYPSRGQEGIKVDIWTEEVQAKLLVYCCFQKGWHSRAASTFWPHEPHNVDLLFWAQITSKLHNFHCDLLHLMMCRADEQKEFGKTASFRMSKTTPSADHNYYCTGMKLCIT